MLLHVVFRETHSVWVWEVVWLQTPHLVTLCCCPPRPRLSCMWRGVFRAPALFFNVGRARTGFRFWIPSSVHQGHLAGTGRVLAVKRFTSFVFEIMTDENAVAGCAAAAFGQEFSVTKPKCGGRTRTQTPEPVSRQKLRRNLVALGPARSKSASRLAPLFDPIINVVA